MEMAEQELPLVFSQMLQLFPNIPRDIIWIYVQRYSNDVEKCMQMLNLQSGKYSTLQSPAATRDCKNLNECYSKIINLPPHVFEPSRIMSDNNNDLHMIKNVPLLNNETNDLINENTNDNKTTTQNKPSLELQLENCAYALPSMELLNADSPKNLNNSRNFQEPLSLQINVDDEDGSLHSWRPNLAECNLSSDFFLPSPMFQNFQFNCSQRTDSHSETHSSEIKMNPEGVRQEPQRYSSSPLRMLQEHPVMSGNVYSIDITSYLHYQKSKLNAIQYEVIKAKIDLSDLKESIDRLSYELKEKTQSKSAQDIEKLKAEIVQLRLECQCLCNEVDISLEQDQVLLGEVDENCYNEKKSQASENEEHQNVQKDSVAKQNIDDSSKKWQCPKCTFDNHPAINSCEMCHLIKPVEHTQRSSEEHNSCYSPAADESVSVRS